MEGGMALILADILVVVHLLFVAFVMAGGFLLARWPRLLALQLPAVTWAAYIELSGGICPLTPLENHFRTLGGGSAYSDDFVEHYLLPALYPENLSMPLQQVLAGLVVLVNLFAYNWAYRARRRKQAE